jgi:hypothetical protein
MRFTNPLLRWYVAFGVILLMSFITLATTPNVLGYETNITNNSTQYNQVQSTATFTVSPTATGSLTTTVTPTLTLTPTATLQPTATPVPTPRGDKPETARTAMYVKPPNCIEMMCPGSLNAPAWDSPGNWTWIEPHSSTWYKLYGGTLQLLVWLFANGQSGITFDVYAPDQKDLYGNPVGRGSFNPSQRPADLFYSGRTQAGGIWYVRVNNHNPFPVSYSLRYTTSIPAIRNVCDACHIPLGDLMFDRCVSGPNSTFCDDLWWLYQQNPEEYDHSIPGR